MIELCSYPFLNGLLVQSLQASLHRDSDCTFNLGFALKHIPAVLNPFGTVQPKSNSTLAVLFYFLFRCWLFGFSSATIRGETPYFIFFFVVTVSLLQIEWPLNIVITESSIAKYNKVRSELVLGSFLHVSISYFALCSN